MAKYIRRHSLSIGEWNKTPFKQFGRLCSDGCGGFFISFSTCAVQRMRLGVIGILNSGGALNDAAADDLGGEQIWAWAERSAAVVVRSSLTHRRQEIKD